MIPLLPALLAACTPAAPPRPPDVLVVTVDTLRADHVGAWADADARTPAMDALARAGTRFSRALTVSNNTLPAHVSMFTGLLPPRHGVPRNGHRLRSGVPWLPEILREHGYETAAFVSASALSGRLGLSRGFDLYDDDFDVREVDQRQRRATTTVRAALAWLRAEHEAPVFLWVHLFDPHYPYTPPPPFDASPSGYSGPADGSMEYLLHVWGRLGRERIEPSDADRRRLVELYDGEIAYADRALAPLLDAARERDALVVLLADHGESLTEHGYLFDHGRYLYQPTLHVPFAVLPPASWGLPPRESDALVQPVDVLPTVLAAAGVAPPEGIDGRDLLPLLRGEAQAVREAAVAESCRPWSAERKGEWPNARKARALVRWPHKLVRTPHAGRVELYDLEADPAEERDLSGERPELVAELSALLAEALPGGVATAADADNRRALRALGYVEDAPER